MKSNNVEELDAIEVEIAGLMDMTLPSPDLLEFYRRINKREIVWNGEINDSIAELSMYIRKWNAEDAGIAVEDRKPIRIFIQSDGGDAMATMSLIDVINLSKTPVHTIALGRAYSAGGLLLIAGHKRYVFKNTVCLIHDGYTGGSDSIGKMMDRFVFTERAEQAIKDFVVSRTKITQKEYEDNYRRDWYLFSDEIIQYGVADEIVTDIDMII